MQKTKRILLLLCTLMLFKFFSSNSKSETSVKYNRDLDDLVIGLKTGKSTILRRVPIQKATFLSDVRNLVIFGDEDALIGGLEMINIIKNSSYGRSVNELRKIVGKDSYKNPAEELIPDKQSLGWMMDAHKNLPALEYLSIHYPDAQWYLLIDDDTYLFKKNLQNFLIGLNSSEPYYIGTPYTFKGCGTPPGESGPLFAQGGSGILISRGALEQLVPLIADCNHKYRDCTAGDVRTALCFKDAGILLTRNMEFNAFPPSLFNLRSPCSQPLTFHHLLPFHFEDLHYLDHHNVTMSKLFEYYSRQNPEIVSKLGHMEIDSDRVGFDYKTMDNVMSARSCYDLCRKDEECAAFSYIYPQCWLKHGIPGAIYRQGCYSGAFPERFICRDN